MELKMKLKSRQGLQKGTVNLMDEETITRIDMNMKLNTGKCVLRILF